jgi:predicted membrane-bound spermidine synthase
VFHLAAAPGSQTLPLLVRFAVRSDGQVGSRVGTLYAANTLGAAAGTLATAFLLLPRLGLNGSVLVAVGLNASAFLLALPQSQQALVRVPAPPAQRPNRDLLLLVLLSSAVSLTYEILWTRLLTFALGASVYAFATMLATFLLGIALGSGLAARFARGPESGRRGFAMSQVGIAVLSLLAFHTLDRLPELARRLSTSGVGTVASGVVLSALTLLPGAICVGASFPFAVRALATNADEAGAVSARVYGWSTIGAVLGSILGGLVLLPALRFEGALIVTCATGFAIAAAAALVARPRFWLALVCATLGIVCLSLWPPAVPWQLLRHTMLPGDWKGDTIYYGVGRGSTVLVIDQGSEWRLTSDGLPESAIQGPGARPSRYGVAHWLSLLAIAARPDTRSLLVVGFGAGKSVEDVPSSVASVDVVELEPEIIAANRVLSGLRRKDPLADPRLHLSLNDARSALLLTERAFDAIVSQPSHPWTAGASHLYTREFFELVRERLSDDGVLVQWMGQQFVDEPLLRTLLATLESVFPEVEVYEPPSGGSLLLLASRHPLDLEATAGRAIASDPAIWAAQGVRGVDDLLVARVQDQAGVARIAAGAPLNTDQRNRLMTESPRVLSHPLGVLGSDRLFAPFDPLRQLASGPRAAHIVRLLVRGGRLPRARRVVAAMPEGASRQVAQALVEIAARQPARGEGLLTNALRRWPAEPELLRALLVRRASALTEGDDPDGLLPRLRGDALASALLEGWRLQRAGREAEVERLEATLAQCGPAEDLFGPVLQLRVAWRHARGDAPHAREALELLDPWLANGVTAADLLLRARLAASARDTDAELASLYELADAGGTREDRTAIARQAAWLLDGLSPETLRLPRVARARERLRSGVGEATVTPAADGEP